MNITLPETNQASGRVQSDDHSVNLVQHYRVQNSRLKPESTHQWCRYGELLEILVRVMVLSRGRANLRSLLEDWSVENISRVAGKSAASKIHPNGKCQW